MISCLCEAEQAFADFYFKRVRLPPSAEPTSQRGHSLGQHGTNSKEIYSKGSTNID